MRLPLLSLATGPVPGAHVFSPAWPPMAGASRAQWPAVPMYLLPSAPWNRKFRVHWPTDDVTMAPGRTPGHDSTAPTGAAVVTFVGIRSHGWPPRVKLPVDGADRSALAPWMGARPGVAAHRVRRINMRRIDDSNDRLPGILRSPRRFPVCRPRSPTTC